MCVCVSSVYICIRARVRMKNSAFFCATTRRVPRIHTVRVDMCARTASFFFSSVLYGGRVLHYSGNYREFSDFLYIMFVDNDKLLTICSRSVRLV